MKKTSFAILLALAALALAACGTAPAQSWSGVAISADAATVYVTRSTHLYALNTRASGQTLWQFPPDNDNNIGPFYADPALAGDTLIITSYNKSVYALDANSGAQKWAFAQSKDRYIAPAAVFGDTVYAASADNTLYALDLASGNLKWTFDKATAGLWGAALPAEDKVFVPSMDHNLYAVDAATGNQLWAVTLNGALAGAPALGDGVIYVGSLNDTLYALDMADGSEQWTVKADGWVWGTPLVVGETLYFGDLAGNVYSVDALSGGIHWKSQVGGAVRGAPSLSGDTLIVPVDDVSNGIVVALNAADGSTRWQKIIDERNADRMLANPVIANDAALIVPMNAEKLIYALSLGGGAELWAVKP